jgi:hypothetical protein
MPVADDGPAERDVAVVGGGPAGSSAAVFLARYGLDTVVFDRGNAALQRCAYLSNYLGFPGGIGVDEFHELMHAHVGEAGAERVPEMVVSVERSDDGFVVETQEGRTTTVDSVLAAAWYDGSYLRPLDGGEMFEEHEHHGEVEDRFDPSYPDEEGRTPVDGLYVASPAEGRSAQAIVAAGNGAHVARRLIEDRRRERGFPEGVAPLYDWLRRDAEFTGEWGERERWREWFENEAGDHDLDDDRFEELRETYLDRAFGTRLSREEAEERADRGLERFVEVVGSRSVLDAVDDNVIHEYLAVETENE